MSRMREGEPCCARQSHSAVEVRLGVSRMRRRTLSCEGRSTCVSVNMFALLRWVYICLYAFMGLCLYVGPAHKSAALAIEARNHCIRYVSCWLFCGLPIYKIVSLAITFERV